MSTITLPIAFPWSVCTPPLFRFLDETYVDEFFDDGSLRLSSFAAFKKHPDEARLDQSEGDVTFVNRTYEGTGQTILAETSHGADAYVLSMTTRYDVDLMKLFNVDSCFVIGDPLNFGLAVSRRTPGFVAGLEGNCVYQGTRIVEGTMPAVDVDRYRDPVSGEIRTDQVQRLLQNEMGHRPLFVKEKRYAYQSEYRIVWITDSPTEDYLQIKVPAARQFCRRMSDLTK